MKAGKVKYFIIFAFNTLDMLLKKYNLHIKNSHLLVTILIN